MNHEPLTPHDPILRELHRLGQHFGIQWGSAAIGETTIEGHLLIDFGNASLSTLTNLHNLLRETNQ